MDLSYNNLSGLVPASFASMRNIISLNISHNQFTGGGIPDYSEDDMDKLALLDFSYNNFADKLETVKGPPYITEIHLEGNDQLYGDVQTAYASLRRLVTCIMPTNATGLNCPSNFEVCCGSSATSTTQSSTVSTTSSTTTTSGGCKGYECECSSVLASISTTAACTQGVWQIEGSATNDGTTTVGTQDTIIIQEDFTQTSEAYLTVYVDATSNQAGQIQVTNTAQLNGTLIIAITSRPSSNSTLSIITASQIQGSFSSVQVETQYSGSSCKSTEATPSYSATSMSVLVRPTKGKCSGNKNKTIGIAVGASVGGVILITIVASTILICLQRKGKANVLFWSNSTQHSRDTL